MKRFAYKRLLTWKDSFRRKPLLLRGARQVGKSWLVEKFGRSEFSYYLKIDLEKSPELKSVFEGELSPEKICRELELLTGSKIQPGKTLLFIDEIQTCPRALTALRYFYEELPLLHVVAAGSLLDFALEEISFPVGRVQLLKMNPLSFIEYIAARGNEPLSEMLIQEPQPLSQATHSTCLEYLKEYLYVGGMPEAVKIFCATNSFIEAFEVHKEIIETYRLDFGKYAGKADTDCLREVWQNAARNTGQQIKYSTLSQNFSNPTISKALHLLARAGLLYKVQSVNPQGLPLEASASTKVFKSIGVDIGLMQHLCGQNLSPIVSYSSLLDMHRGGLAEQFVGQELIATDNKGPYYWSRHKKSSTAEIDYCIETLHGSVVPIEVKASRGGRLRSLQIFLESFDLASQGLVFSTRELEKDERRKLTYCPLYFAWSAMGGKDEL